jgi:hypothetical protein
MDGTCHRRTGEDGATRPQQITNQQISRRTLAHTTVSPNPERMPHTHVSYALFAIHTVFTRINVNNNNLQQHVSRIAASAICYSF